MDKDLISRSALRKKVNERYHDPYFDICLREAPAVDAVEVVRCKDCVYRHTNPHCHGRPMDWYCPNGEGRRSDG